MYSAPQPGGRGWRNGGLAQPSSQPQSPGQSTLLRLLRINLLCTQLGGRGWREGGLARPAGQPRDPGQCGAPQAPRTQEDQP